MHQMQEGLHPESQEREDLPGLLEEGESETMIPDYYGESIARCDICHEWGVYDAMCELSDPFKNDARMRHHSCEG